MATKKRLSPFTIRAASAALITLATFSTYQAFAGSTLHPKQLFQLHKLGLLTQEVPTPADMFRLTENVSFVVPANAILSVNGIITTENWTAASPVVIRFDGETVFKREMLAGEVLSMPPGLSAKAGTVVEIDRQSAATDSRVALLAYLTHTY